MDRDISCHLILLIIRIHQISLRLSTAFSRTAGIDPLYGTSGSTHGNICRSGKYIRFSLIGRRVNQTARIDVLDLAVGDNHLPVCASKRQSVFPCIIGNAAAE